MRGADYGFIAITQNGAWADGLARPPQIMTAWGPAVRADQDGKLIWGGDIYVTVDSLKGLSLRLPHDMAGFAYTTLIITGPYFTDVSAMPTQDGKRMLSRPTKLSALLWNLCMHSPRWGLFALYGWEDVAQTFRVEINDACTLIDDFITNARDDLDYGFEVFAP